VQNVNFALGKLHFTRTRNSSDISFALSTLSYYVVGVKAFGGWLLLSECINMYELHSALHHAANKMNI
jgi:hypothetical protein